MHAGNCKRLKKTYNPKRIKASVNVSTNFYGTLFIHLVLGSVAKSAVVLRNWANFRLLPNVVY